MKTEEAKANLEKLLLLYDDGMIDFSEIRESVKTAIEALRQMSGTSDAEFWKKRALEYSKTCSDLCSKLSEGNKCDSIQLDENGITFHLSENAITCEGCRYDNREDNPCYDCMRMAQDFYEPENSPTQIPGASDLISRQVVIDLWESYHPYIAVKAIEFDRELRRLPSAQPEIIHCKDCIHYCYADNSIPQEHRHTCNLDGDRWKPDDFCSFAEREING